MEATAPGKKLFLSMLVQHLIVPSFLPESSLVTVASQGEFVSVTMLVKSSQVSFIYVAQIHVKKKSHDTLNV